MSNEARVGIGLPVFNGANYLRETLESIQAQTFTDFEVLISDNDSTDDTRRIAEEFVAGDERFRLQVHPENLGAHRNYNSVVPHLRNEYFKWAAHDDLIAPTFLERCVEKLDAEPKAVLAFTATHRVDEEGAVIDTLRSTSSYDSDSPSSRLRAYVGDRLKAPPLFGLQRRSALAKTALLRNYHASDFTFLQELAMLGRFTYSDEPLFSFRQHAAQHSAGTPTETASFFNPGQQAPMMSTWRAFGGLLDSIRRVPMSPVEKLKCGVFAGYWAFRHGDELFGDARARGRYEVGRLVGTFRR